MADFSPYAPRWARRPSPQDGVRDPGYVVRFNYGRPEYRRRISGVGGVQREAALQAFRERTNVRPAAPPPPPQPTHGELRRGADGVTWRYDATKGKGQRLGLDNVGVTEDAPLSQKDLATQQWENRKRQLAQGGISAPEAERAATDEVHAVTPTVKNLPIAATASKSKVAGADQLTIESIRKKQRANSAMTQSEFNERFTPQVREPQVQNTQNIERVPPDMAQTILQMRAMKNQLKPRFEREAGL